VNLKDSEFTKSKIESNGGGLIMNIYSFHGLVDFSITESYWNASLLPKFYEGWNWINRSDDNNMESFSGNFENTDSIVVIRGIHSDLNLLFPDRKMLKSEVFLGMDIPLRKKANFSCTNCHVTTSVTEFPAILVSFSASGISYIDVEVALYEWSFVYRGKDFIQVNLAFPKMAGIVMQNFEIHVKQGSIIFGPRLDILSLLATMDSGQVNFQVL
jgi:hypothetical protein